jgi:broad specificity phosphatase PhoE
MKMKVGRRRLVMASLVVGTLLAACAGSPRPASPASAPPPVAIFLLRHAEKAANDPKDPDLSDAGRARAAALATLLEHAGVTHLFATDMKRTRQTLAPLAAKCGRTVAVVPAESVDRQVEALRELPPGSVAVVAGHSNTIPAIARALGGTAGDVTASPDGDLLPDYGRLLLVIRYGAGPATTQTLRLQFGDAWSSTAPAH